jgi:hypothetical protein
MGRPKGSKNKKGSRFDTIAGVLELTTRQGECYNWGGALDAKGYPISSYKGKSIRVHRWVACMVEGVPYDDPRQTRHLCKNNPSCVNPTHLKLGTATENSRDKDYNTNAFLEDWDGLRQLGLTFKQIGDLYGFEKSTVAKAVRRHERGEW